MNHNLTTMADGRAIELYEPVDLKSRLKKEQEVLEGWFYSESKKFPLKYTNGLAGLPYFEYDVELKNDRKYRLRVYVNEGYPDNLPDLVVCKSPEPMPTGPFWSGCHDTHTWPRLEDGFLHICHWHWAAWKRENMIYQVFEKGKEWLEAYEKYLVDGKLPLNLEQMKLTDEEKLIEQTRRRLSVLPCWRQITISIDISRQHLRITYTERYALMLIPAAGNAIQRVEDQDLANRGALLLADLIRLHQAIKESREANPGCIIKVSFSIIGDGRWINVNLTPCRG